MKKTLFAFMALATAFLAVSCQSEEELPQEPTEPPTNGVTTGKAKATINGQTIDVNWVQLWENGPKFAEMNLGATSATGVGNTYQFSVTGANDKAATTWGDNWRTPSQGQMNVLLEAATSYGSTKVVCIYTKENGVYGFKFTGKETGYTDNSVFFPDQIGNSFYGRADYWSATANGGYAWAMHLEYYDGYWSSDWYSDYPSHDCLVRPVLQN